MVLAKTQDLQRIVCTANAFLSVLAETHSNSYQIEREVIPIHRHDYQLFVRAFLKFETLLQAH